MFLLIDKPKGITSHDVIDKVRKITGERKVGHAGTLDPNATGLLIVAIKRSSTKRLSGFVGLDKIYVAEVFLGATSDTDDDEGVISSQLSDVGFKTPNKHNIREVLKQYVGEQEQVPPIYSSIKIRGKPAHRRVRRGEEVKLKSRKISIHSIELVDFEYPILKIKTNVSSGTYIRSLARDIGESLGCGAYLRNLRRTSVGNYKVENSVKLGKLTKDNWKELSLRGPGSVKSK